MNLHNIVGPCVAAVNPWVTATYKQSTGYATNPDGTRAPSYATPVSIQVQMQALQYRDLMQLEGLNIQGVRQAMYINGNIEGVDRASQRGGDLITLPDNSVWLVALVLEDWYGTDGWTKVAVTKQDGS
jgi:hypothetical protein